MLRYLYRSYHQSEALKHFLMRRILPAGWGVIIAAVVSATMLMGSPIRPLYQFFALPVGLAALTLIWAWSRRARLSAVRQVPPHASAGTPFHYHITLINEGGDIPDCKLMESPADPRPDRESFLHEREPAEAQRNTFDRLFAYHRWQWLVERNKSFDQGVGSAVITVPAAGGSRVNMVLTPRRRGMIELDDLRVLLPDPLHFFQRARKVAAAPAHVAVLPRRYRLPALNLPGSAHYQAGDDAASRQNGNTGEFTALREYRSGDPPRLIHWKSWAKTGRPIVKEVEDMRFPRYALILDTFAAAGRNQAFEEAVSVAASFVAAIDGEDAMLDLILLGGHNKVITAGKGLADSVKLLEALAAVTITPVEDFPSLARLASAHSADLAACICVFTGWSDSRAEFLRILKKNEIDLLALAVVEQEDLAILPPEITALRSTRIQEDLLRCGVMTPINVR